MNTAPVPSEAPTVPLRVIANAPRRELTLRAVITAMAVAAIVGASYPYVVLKLGYGPNISVVSAFFGYMALSAIGFVTGARGSRYENNLVQTAGTAAGEAGFMCVVLAAFDMLNQRPELGFSVHLTVWQTFIWLTLAGLTGVLLAVPLRRHYIEEEDLTFADGTAAGETLVLLDQGRASAKAQVTALSAGMGLSALVAFLRDSPIKVLKLLPGEIAVGAHGEALRMGSEVSLLSFGSGLLIGVRVTMSIGLGMLVSWVIAPPMLVARGIVPAETFKDVIRWVMWPATGMMVAGGLTALVLKWRLIVGTLRSFSTRDLDGKDFPIKWVGLGVAVFSVALAVQQHVSLGFPYWLSAVSLVLSFMLMLVGTRVLGETNWAPISALANLMQAVFAGLSPANIQVNMIGSSMSGTIAAHGEHLMQDYKAGKIVGSTPRYLTYVQLMAVPVGSLAVALVYPALRAKYGIGDGGLSSPVSVKWAGFAELLHRGFDALPRGCFTALWVAVALGCVMTVLEPKYHRFVPSPTGVGIGMLIPGFATMPIVIGGFVQYFWRRLAPEQESTFRTPLASGLIAGEALLVLALTIVAITSP